MTRFAFCFLKGDDVYFGGLFCHGKKRIEDFIPLVKKEFPIKERVIDFFIEPRFLIEDLCAELWGLSFK